MFEIFVLLLSIFINNDYLSSFILTIINIKNMFNEIKRKFLKIIYFLYFFFFENMEYL